MGDTVTIAYAEPGKVDGGFMDSVARTLLGDANRPNLVDENGNNLGLERRFDVGDNSAYIRCISGPEIAKARNNLVRRFLESGGEWLWMLDSDMTFSPDCLEYLLAVADKDERPIVGGLCFGGGKGLIFPTMYEIVDPETNHGSPIRTITDWPEGAVVEVDATGAACLLIHHRILEELLEAAPDSQTPWFHESIYKGQPFSEDWTFCMKARMAGHKIYVHTLAKTGHVKTLELNEELWRSGQVPLVCLGGAPRQRLETAKKITANDLASIAMPNQGNRQQRRHPAGALKAL